MNRDILLEKASAAAELFAAIENALEAIGRHPECAHPLTASEVILREAYLKHIKMLGRRLSVVRHRDLGQDEEGSYFTEYALSDGRRIVSQWRPDRKFTDAGLRIAHDKTILARYGVSEESFEAYIDRLSRE